MTASENSKKTEETEATTTTTEDNVVFTISDADHTELTEALAAATDNESGGKNVTVTRTLAMNLSLSLANALSQQPGPKGKDGGGKDGGGKDGGGK